MTWQIVQKQWDKICKYTCFILYGALSALFPSGSTAAGPRFFGLLFSIELALAGAILLASVFTGSISLRIIGYIVYGLGMLTVAALVLVGSGSPIWILVLGFAFHAVMGVRGAQNERQISSELAILTKKLQEGEGRGG